MPLPQDTRAPWPPKVQGLNIWPDMEEWAAWYSGDPNRIALVHSQKVQTPTPQGRMWARDVFEERRVQLHVPMPGDIAGVAADMLFAEAPKFKIAEAHSEKAPQAAKDTQARLDEIVEQANVVQRARNGAEAASAMGGVYLKANWDTGLRPFPILDTAQADNAVPEFRFGFLVAVTFWRELEGTEEGSVVWRHLERHELDAAGNGVILNGLYRGTMDTLGKQVPLDAHPGTAHLVGKEALAPGIKGLLCEYVPNRGPNRRWRGSSLGMSDYNGCEGLFDALDEVYTSWIRDIRLGQRRIIVPEQWLDWVEGADGGTRPKFDVDKEIFTTLNVDPNASDKAGITLGDFSIRAEDHAKSALEIMDRIISTAGYSPQSFGLKIEGSAESGTALRVRERKSFTTTGKKGAIWRRALERMLWVILQLDAALFKTPGLDPNLRPTAELNDGAQPDTSELAASVELVNRAQAASIRTKVAMLHPDWTADQIEAEAKAIEKEQGALVPDPMQTGLA